jgi:hypothetical protein
MGDIISFKDFQQFKSLRASEKIIYSWHTIWYWFLNKFRVHNHEWVDEATVPIVNSAGSRLGHSYVQKCRRCGLRSSQEFTSGYVRTRMGHL